MLARSAIKGHFPPETCIIVKTVSSNALFVSLLCLIHTALLSYCNYFIIREL